MKDLQDLQQDLLQTLFTTTKTKQNKKRFIPNYKTTTYKGTTKKWYINSSNCIKIINDKRAFDRYIVLEDYETEEDFIKHLIDKEIK